LCGTEKLKKDKITKRKQREKATPATYLLSQTKVKETVRNQDPNPKKRDEKKLEDKT